MNEDAIPPPPIDSRRSRHPGPTRAGNALGLAIFVLVLGLLAAGPRPGVAQVRDPRVAWTSIRTEHFVVSYHQPLGVVARRVADVLERVHARIAPVLGHVPRRRIPVVVTDGTDGANGSATALPYTVMRLFVTAPDDLSALSDHDDWLTTLITHEHTHILHLDNIHGFPAIVNALLGRLAAPNQVVPSWLTEGLAVVEESRETSGGRMRSTYFEMYLRMAALEGTLLDFDQVSSGVDAWPHGEVPYLYGSRFMQFIVDRHGVDWIAAMANEYGRRLIPYGINRTALRTTGESFIDLYEAWRESATAKARASLEAVEAEGRIEGDRITFHGEYTESPRFVSNDQLVYFANDGRSDPQIRSIDLASPGSPRRLTRVLGAATLAVTPDGGVVAATSAPHRNLYRFGDLFRVVDGPRALRRLSHGLRAREPDVSPDGRLVAFTMNGAGTTHLVLASLDDIDGTARVLVRNPRFEQIYTPRFSPDGRFLAYSAWRHGGHRDVEIVEIATGTIRAITRDRALDTGPIFSPDGRFLYFSSDRTGIANLYAFELASGVTHRMTNVIGGAYQPTVSPDGEAIVYVGYTSKGFDLHRLAIDPATWRAAPPHVDDRPEPSPAAGSTTARAGRYQAAATLFPRSYALELQDDGIGSQLALLLQGEDAAGYFSWTTRLGVTLDEGLVHADAGLSVRRSPVPFTVSAFRRVTERGLTVGGVGQRWLADTRGASLSASYPILTVLASQSVSATYSVSHVDTAERVDLPLDPNDPPPTLPDLGRAASLRLGWAYSNARRRTYDMTTSAGGTMSMSVLATHRGLGDRYDTFRASWAIERYVEMPFVHHHVLAVRYAGGISVGELPRRSSFFLGGFSQPALIDIVLDAVTLGGEALRGYAPFAFRGSRFQLVQLEYRFPLGRIMHGISSLPLYLKRMHASLFADAGDAYEGRFQPNRIRYGVGAELFTDFTVGYQLDLKLRLGFAYGLQAGGGPRFYAHLGVPF